VLFRSGGTGLGLPISRQLIQQMGGDIHLVSRKNEGVLFWFVLPLLLPEDSEGAGGGVIESSVRSHCAESYSGHILLADDDFINTTLAVSLLEQAGFTVRAVSNGQAAVDALIVEDFDCVLMDVQMPEMDGHEATKVIRMLEKERGGHVPIIAMTACVMQDDLEQCMEVGMDAYMAKPINRAELLGLLKKIISGEDDGASVS